MRKVHLLLALSTLLVIGIVIILIICLRRHSPMTLEVFLNGPISNRTESPVRRDYCVFPSGSRACTGSIPMV